MVTPNAWIRFILLLLEGDDFVMDIVLHSVGSGELKVTFFHKVTLLYTPTRDTLRVSVAKGLVDLEVSDRWPRLLKSFSLKLISDLTIFVIKKCSDSHVPIRRHG